MMSRSVLRCGDAVVNNANNHATLRIQRIKYTPTKSFRGEVLMQPQTNLSRGDNTSNQSGLTTNRHGLFSWERWDGSLWTTEETIFYKRMKINQDIKRMEVCLSKAREKLETAKYSYELDRYWVLRYSELLNAARSLEPFARVVADICILKFLVTTAPILARGNIKKTFTQMDIDCFLIQELTGALVGISRIKSAARHNTLLFKAHVHRDRCRRQVQEGRIDLRLRRKLERQRIKTELGHEAVYSLWHKPQPFRDPATTEIQRGFDTWPSSWAVEGFYSQMLLLLARARARYFECTTYGRLQMKRGWNDETITIRNQRNRQLFNLATKLATSTRDLHDLNEDLAALRYFRISKYPDRDITREVKVGRTLYMAVEDTSSNRPMSLIVNEKRKKGRLGNAATTKADPPEQQKPQMTNPPSRTSSRLPTITRSGKLPPSPRSKKYISPRDPATLSPTKQKRRSSQVKPLSSIKSPSQHGHHHQHQHHHHTTLKLFDSSQDAGNAPSKVIVTVGKRTAPEA